MSESSMGHPLEIKNIIIIIIIIEISEVLLLLAVLEYRYLSNVEAFTY